MTKLEKIEEIIREYENGVDSSIDALDILEGIKNVLNDPSFTRNEEVLRIQTPAGELCAFANTSLDCPSVGIYLSPKGGEGDILDLAYAEVKSDELREKGENQQDVSLYTYADPYAEEYTSKNIIKRKDVEEALGLEKQKESKEGIVR